MIRALLVFLFLAIFTQGPAHAQIPPLDPEGAERQAAPYLERCDQGEPYACEYALAVIKRNDRTFWQSERYVALSTQACEAGSSRSCWNFEWQGVGGVLNPVRRDSERYLPIATTGCDNGSALACWQAGDVRRILGRYSESEILDFFVRSCEGGYADGCEEAAAMQTALGRDASRASIRACYGTAVGVQGKLASCERGCEAGDARSCHEAGIILGRGRDGITPVALDADRAEALFAQACHAGHEPACTARPGD